VALAGTWLVLQVMLAGPAVANPAPVPSAKQSPSGQAQPASGTPSPADAHGPASMSDTQAPAPPASDAALRPEAPPPANPALPPASDAIPPPGAAPPAIAAKPDQPAKAEPARNNLRLAIRVGAPSDARAARHISDNSVGATYFMNDKAYALFANVEAVSLALDKGYDHFESEINLGINPFYARPWLAPVSFTARVTTDWTDTRTLSFGPSINLTNLPFMAPVKAAGFNFFFQYYPLKTDNHWGDQDFMFYWSIPLYARRLSLRGFARLFVSYHAMQQAAISNDLIFEVVPGIDIFLRDLETINEENIPRRAGISLGLRWLQKF
jgi:hypothetical protein